MKGLIETIKQITRTKHKQRQFTLRVTKGTMDRIEAMARLLEAAEHVNGSWTPDFSNDDQAKYFISYKRMTCEIFIDIAMQYEYDCGVICFPSINAAKEVVARLGRKTIKTALGATDVD